MYDINTLLRIAAMRRAEAITMIHDAGTGHTGGTMSSMDILVCLYYAILHIDPKEPLKPDRDLFLLSKGHSVEGLLAILADRGFFPTAELATFSRAGSRLIGHPSSKVPGIEQSSGSLGHGLSVGVGAALASARLGIDRRVYVLLGDGELAEGSNWEAAQAASAFALNRLTAIIDRNGLQISGPTESVMPHGDLAAKWRSFGWEVSELDGNDMTALLEYFTAPYTGEKPRCLIAHTVKGKGLPFAENLPEWHHRVPTDEQLEQAFAALGVDGALITERVRGLEDEH